MPKATGSYRGLTFEPLESRILLAIDVSTNLVGHWTLNDGAGSTVSDYAGANDSGSVVGTPNWTTAGKVHGALNFNGSTNYISVPHSTDLNIVTSNITVSAWVKTTASNGTILSKGLTSGDHIALQIVGGKARFQFNPGGGPFGVTGAQAINDGAWHLVVGVRTGAQSCALYVDGVADGVFNGTSPFNSIDLTSPLQIGALNGGALFNGTLDDVRFYKRSLSEADIAALFTLGVHPIGVDDSYTLFSQTTTFAATSGVLINDLPRDNTAVTATLVTNAAHGSVSLNANGSFTYTPQTGYAGTDQFTYRIADDVNSPTTSTVSLNVYSLTDWNTVSGRVLTRAMFGATSISANTVNTIVGLMNPDGSFSDLTYTSNTAAGASALNTHASRMSTLSRAYQAVGGPKYLDATVGQRIVDGYTYLAYTAPNTLTLPNWYDTKIGVPNNLWPGLVAMRTSLNSTLLSDLVVKFYDLATVWDMDETNEKMGGANLADRARATLAVAVLKGDPATVPEIVARLSTDLASGGLQATGQMPDNSFSQHTTYPTGATYQGGVIAGDQVRMYAGSYGIDYASATSDVVPWLHDTQLAFSSTAENAVVNFTLDGQQWLFRNQAIEPTSTGRALSRKGQTISTVQSHMSSSATRLQALGIRTDELQDFVDRLATGTTSTNFLSGNKAFYTTDTMVQQREGYMAAVRMISQRTIRPETLQIPGGTVPEGGKNYFLGDGFTTIYQSGTEFGSVSGQEVFPAWDWSLLRAPRPSNFLKPS